MQSKIVVGIVGCGFVGGALKRWLEEHNPDIEIRVSDPPKNYNDSLESCDVIFISIHIPTETDGTQDLGLLKSIIAELPDKPIFIRTTVLPNTCDSLAKEFNKKIYFMPEFLTERTAYNDFCSQPMIFCGEEKLLGSIFVGKKHICMSNFEAELTKYAHNVFGALKVTYFNGINELCEKYKCDYQTVQKGILLSGYINDTHTYIALDGKLGYGGKCFPKDTNAFERFTKGSQINKLISATKEINKIYRGE